MPCEGQCFRFAGGGRRHDRHIRHGPPAGACLDRGCRRRHIACARACGHEARRSPRRQGPPPVRRPRRGSIRVAGRQSVAAVLPHSRLRFRHPVRQRHRWRQVREATIRQEICCFVFRGDRAAWLDHARPPSVLGREVRQRCQHCHGVGGSGAHAHCCLRIRCTEPWLVAHSVLRPNGRRSGRVGVDEQGRAGESLPGAED
mmetsp:Transcript_28992/g.87704  ORF Transcript_28992/g.87704 Transcript_28992/m.87704 type:complete len:201 (-) Transcript_28992:691-1293(-)